MLGTLLFWAKPKGESMWPELVSGKRYLATSFLKPKQGSYVVARAPEGGPIIIKKVFGQDGDRITIGSTVSWGSTWAVKKDAIIGVLLKK